MLKGMNLSLTIGFKTTNKKDMQNVKNMMLNKNTSMGILSDLRNTKTAITTNGPRIDGMVFNITKTSMFQRH